MNVLILAAGLGTRLRPLTDKIPKPCVPFLNVPMGLYPFRFLDSLNVSQITVNTHHLPEQIVELYEKQPYYRGPLKFSHETGQILGSAGGLKKASQHFAKTEDDTILLLNADEVFFGADKKFLADAYAQHKKQKARATIVVMKHPEAGKKFGAIWCEDKTVKVIGKAASSETQRPFHYIGMIFLEKDFLPLIPDNKDINIFYDLFNQHMKDNRIQIFEVDCQWYETGNPTDYLAASQIVLSQLSAETLGFINQFDASEIIENASGLSLVSKSVQMQSLTMSGYNIISKTTNPGLLQSLGSIQNSILFGSELVTEKYFTVSARS